VSQDSAEGIPSPQFAPKKSEGGFRPPRLNVRGLAYSLPHLEADSQPQLNDPVGTGARAERGRGRIAQTSKIRVG